MSIYYMIALDKVDLYAGEVLSDTSTLSPVHYDETYCIISTRVYPYCSSGTQSILDLEPTEDLSLT